MSPQGKLIIFSAPSGSGKTTLVHYLLSQMPVLEFSVSAASRPKRPNEEHGKDYYFLTPEEFRQRIANNEFVEWEEVYENSFYGTLRSEIERIWAGGKHVIFDVDVEGGLNLKKQYGDKALAVFVKVPSVDVLEQRLRERNTESEESLQKRIAKAKREIAYEDRFDKVVLNRDIEEAKRDALELVKNFIGH